VILMAGKRDFYVMDVSGVEFTFYATVPEMDALKKATGANEWILERYLRYGGCPGCEALAHQDHYAFCMRNHVSVRRDGGRAI
jgi:hypothetical protein